MKEKYIKLSQALEVLDSCSCWWAHDRMEAIPAADVRPVVRGKWEYEEQEVGGINGGVGTIWGYRCPRCDTLNVYQSNFCPNCGADMMEES